MTTATCPSCNRRLSVPDEAVGKQAQCPACQTVFQIGGFSAAPLPLAPPAVPAAPSLAPTRPPPLPDDDESTLPRSSRRDRYDDDDFARPIKRRFDLEAALAVTRGPAIVEFVTLGFNALAAFLFIVVLLTSPGPNEDKGAGLLCMFVLVAPPMVFILVGAIQLLHLRSKGLIITGAVMNFILGAVLTIVTLIVLLSVLERRPFRGPVSPLIWIGVLFYLVSAVLNILAGVRSLVVLGHPDVRGAFR